MSLQRRQPMRRGKSLKRGRPKKRGSVAQPSSAQRAWRERVRELGSIVDGATPCEIHHPVGRTGKHNGIEIGHWWVLPLTAEQHRGPDGIHRAPDRKAREKALFRAVLALLRAREQFAINERAVWPPQDVLDAIDDYHR